MGDGEFILLTGVGGGHTRVEVLVDVCGLGICVHPNFSFHVCFLVTAWSAHRPVLASIMRCVDGGVCLVSALSSCATEPKAQHSYPARDQTIRGMLLPCPYGARATWVPAGFPC